MPRPTGSRRTALGALSADQFRRGWWRVLNALVAALGTGAIVYSSLLRAGPLDPQAGRALLLVLTGILFVAAVGAILTTIGSPSRLYLLPLSNRRIAAATMLPCALCVGAVYAVTATALNRVFAVEWPVLGPSLFLGAAAAVMQAISLAAGPAHLARLAVWSVAGVLLAGWLQGRYGGGAFPLPRSMWSPFTTMDVFAISLLTCASFLVIWVAIARDRRGDLPVVAIWSRIPAISLRWRPPRAFSRFASASGAQFWFEWRQKGFIVPAIFGVFSFFLLAACFLCQIENREYELLHGCFGFGTGLVPIAAVVGLVMGHLNLKDANPECGSFLATRPVTDRFLAGTLIKAAGAGLLVTWLLWCAAMLAATGWLYWEQGSAPVLDLWTMHGKFAGALASLGYWYAALLFLVVLIAAWVGLSLAASLALTGRQRLLVGSVAIVVPILLTVLFLAGRAAEGHVDVPQGVLHFLIGSISIAGTAWLFTAAVRRGQFGFLFGLRVLVVWLLASAGSSCLYILIGPLHISDLVLMSGLLALPMAPFAAAPLALAWNRHR